MGLMYEIFAQMWVQAYLVVVVVTNVAIWHKIHKQEKAIREISNRAISNHAQSCSRKKKEVNRARMVAMQSTLYIGAFISCWIGPTAFHLADWISGFKSFWAVLLIVIFTPLQGFWNAIIFARPTYIRLRRKYPNLKRLQAVKVIFFTSDPVTTTETLFSAGASSSVMDGRSKRNLGRLIDDDSFAGDNEDDNKDLSDETMANACKEADLFSSEESTRPSISMVKGSNGDEPFQENA